VGKGTAFKEGTAMRRWNSWARHCRPFILFLPGLLLAACGGTPMPGGDVPPPDTVIKSENEPPPLQPYVVPPPPSAKSGTVTWEFAHWHREGDNYVWVPGHYVDHPETSNWQAGHWIYSGRTRWIWIPGHPE
jgi:YXWGXW repeat-containing protein